MMPSSDDENGARERRQERKAKEKGVPEGDILYRSARQDGETALALSSRSAAWSGLAAGVSMGFSLLGEGLLRSHVPDASWAPLITKFGYSLGFLIVILGRQQLFTEQTLTAILPMLAHETGIADVARLWTVVLLANLVGVAAFGAFTAFTPAFPPDMQQTLSAIGEDAMSLDFWTTMVRAVYAGFLVATMVWLLPGAGAARLWIVVFLSWVVGLGAFPHVVAGSAEAIYVVFRGERTVADYVLGYLVPTLVGNAAGGVLLVGALAHAQHAPDQTG